MNEMRVWLTSLGFAILFCAVTGMLVPSGKFEKGIKTLISVFFLCALILPLTSIKFRISVPVHMEQETGQTASRIENLLEDQAVRFGGASVEKVIRDQLTAEGITPKAVTAFIDYQGEVLTVQKVTVWFQDADVIKGRQQVEKLKGKLGILIEVAETREE